MVDCAAYIGTYSNALLQRPEYVNCDFPKQFASGKLDSRRLKAIDCTLKLCKTVIEGNKNAFSVFPGCSLPDTASGNTPVELATLSSLCMDIAIVDTGVVTAPPSSSPSAFAPAFSPSPSNPSPVYLATPPSSTRSTLDAPNNTGILVAAGASIAVLALVICGYVYMRTRRKHTTSAFARVEDGERTDDQQTLHKGDPTSVAPSTTSSTGDSSYAVTGELDLAEMERHRIPAANVVLVKTLASGAFGQVWLGQLNTRQVAVKTLLTTCTTKSDLQKFMCEIALCEYVVSFIGVAWTRPTDMMLITEFMDGGDLRSALQTNLETHRRLTWKMKVQIAHRIAEGLVYLHSMAPKVIHRDLKSRNVLLDSVQGAKITDFGISREANDATMTAGIGTYRWMAPEVLRDGHYSELSDLFSFGVILAELDTEILPYSDLRNDKGNLLTDTAIMAKVMAGQLRPTHAPQCPDWFVTLGRNCTALHQMDRPTAVEVAYVLGQHLSKL
ncbi:hypothetical protein DYB31_006200 [Aphanomyces astaci]|uniref:Protein kinase domain-containing protein n=2 Tax=Aphanomyces astaci TaxID=112090 RepID=A0A397EPC8_APHAT|nr:hypothetical protein DYB31_006200 [Aphanomyces astaci]